METKMISIARDFSPHPAGRYRSDGPFSGEKFRDDFLYPALLGSAHVEVDMDGALGYGSSFLDEAFAGLVRKHGLSAKELRIKLNLKCAVRLFADRAWQYIDEEDARRKH